MTPKIFAGTAHRSLAESIARVVESALAECAIERFPDGEIHVDVREPVRGDDVYLVQPTGPPVAEHLLELLLLADACRRAGAARTTAIVPYFGYARQDRRCRTGEPLGGRLMAELTRAALVDRVVAVDLHTASLESAFGMPLEHVSAVPLLAAALTPSLSRDAVIVSPDLGAAKLAERYARLLERPVAIVHKRRVSGTEVRTHGVAGDVAGRQPIIVDDMLSTGGTVEAAVRAVLAAGAVAPVTVVVTHLLLVGSARERLAALPIRRILATDTLPPPAAGLLALESIGVGGLLGDVVRRLHHDEPLDDLLAES
jgi:ribose-phosphate pyrophosphokinase